MKKNPIDFLVDGTGLTRAEVTAKQKLGKNLLLRMSQGRLQGITERMSDVLWAEWDRAQPDHLAFVDAYGTEDLDTAYQAWVKSARKSRKGKLPKVLSQDVRIPPFGRLVKAIGSVSKTAQFLAVADLPVQQYAKGKQLKMPDVIREALTDLAYPHIEELDSAQRNWNRKAARGA